MLKLGKVKRLRALIGLLVLTMLVLSNLVAVLPAHADTLTPFQDPQTASNQPGQFDSPALTSAQDASTPTRSSQEDLHTTDQNRNKTYHLTFDTGGGSSTENRTVLIQEGARVARPSTNPIRSGYLFDGWFINGTNQAYDFNQPITADLTLAAHWSKVDNTWNISPNQGASAGGAQAAITTQYAPGIRFNQTSTRYSHTLALGSDGNLYSWGSNETGQLGDGTSSNRSQPTLVNKPDGVSDSFTWTQVSAGSDHSLALGSDGNLYSWGNNRCGQLGDKGISTKRVRPGLVSKPDGVSDSFTWTQVSAGSDHSLALGSDGNLYSWGNNNTGQLGDGTFITKTRPVLVSKPAGVDNSFTWIQVKAGSDQTLALGSDGNLYSWGNNNTGQLGDGTTKNRSVPGLVSKPAGVDNSFTWTQISTKDRHSLALGSDGNLYSWGNNNTGQLGDGTTKNRSVPGLVSKPAGVDTSFTWSRASLGYFHSSALGSDGNLYSWGDNSSGQLGDRTLTNRTSPVLVSKPAGADTSFTWTGASIGYYYSLAFGSDGNLYSWGNNSSGQLGDGTSTNRSTPGLLSFPGQLTVSEVKFGGRPGSLSGGQDDGTWLVTVPAKLTDNSSPQVDVAVTWSLNGATQPPIHLTYTYILPTYAYILPTYTVTFNSNGGTPTSTESLNAGSRATRPDNPSRQGFLFDGWFIMDTNQAYDFSQPVTTNLTLSAHWTKVGKWTISPNKGPESGGTRVTLTPPTLQDIRFNQVSTWSWHTLAIGSDGNLYSWGWNSYGQLGDGTITSRSKPVLVDKPVGTNNSFTWVQASAGQTFSLVLGSDGNLYSWGWNNNGQLGEGSTTQRSRPGLVSKPDGASDSFTWVQVSAGTTHSLALGSDGNLYSWGNNTYSQLGEGTINNRQRPGLVKRPAGVSDSFTWAEAIAGNDYSLALGSDGNLYAWGVNVTGQLGTGSYDSQATPVLVQKPSANPDSFAWKQVSAGNHHVLALDSDGNLYSWGKNERGQLGDGTTSNRNTPGLVSKPTGEDSFTWTKVSAGYYHSSALGSDGNIYTWGGNNLYPLLGDGTYNSRTKPGLAFKPEGKPATFTWLDTISSFGASFALGSDGYLYSWGSDNEGGLGNGGVNSQDQTTPEPVAPPDRLAVRGVKFGDSSATGSLERQKDGSWTVTSPEHAPGNVPVVISWTQDTIDQNDDTSNTFTYMKIGLLPDAGGSGIFLFILIGFIMMTVTLGFREYCNRQSSQY